MHPNINYELLNLESLLSKEAKVHEMSGTAIRSKVRSEVDRIKSTLVYEVFHFEDERHLERYIQYHQQALIRLIDKSDLALGQNVGDNERNAYELLYKAFEELLAYIERHFTKYFDQDVKAPDGYLNAARKEAQASIETLLKSLAPTGADDRLLELLFR